MLRCAALCCRLLGALVVVYQLDARQCAAEAVFGVAPRAELGPAAAAAAAAGAQAAGAPRGWQVDCGLLWHMLAALTAGRPALAFVGWVFINDVPRLLCNRCLRAKAMLPRYTALPLLALGADARGRGASGGGGGSPARGRCARRLPLPLHAHSNSVVSAHPGANACGLADCGAVQPARAHSAVCEQLRQPLLAQPRAQQGAQQLSKMPPSLRQRALGSGSDQEGGEGDGLDVLEAAWGRRSVSDVTSGGGAPQQPLRPAAATAEAVAGGGGGGGLCAASAERAAGCADAWSDSTAELRRAPELATAGARARARQPLLAAEEAAEAAEPGIVQQLRSVRACACPQPLASRAKRSACPAPLCRLAPSRALFSPAASLTWPFRAPPRAPASHEPQVRVGV